MTIPGVIRNQVPVEPWKGGGGKWKSTLKKNVSVQKQYYENEIIGIKISLTISLHNVSILNVLFTYTLNFIKL